MAPRKTNAPGARTAEHTQRAFRPRYDENNPLPERHIIPHDSWISALLIDTATDKQQDGTPVNVLTFEVSQPKLYARQQLRALLNKKLEKSLDRDNEGSIASAFPDVDLLDEHDTWDKLGGKTFRIHVGHREYVELETGEKKKGYRVGGFRLADR